VQHFSRLGKITRFDVTEAPKEAALEMMISQATRPEFLLCMGLSKELTPNVADMIAKDMGCEKAIRLEPPKEKDEPVDIEMQLKPHVESGKKMFVLDRFLENDTVANEFLKLFGNPQMVVNVRVPDDETHAEILKGEISKADEEADPPREAKEPEELDKIIGDDRASYTQVMQVLTDRCASAIFDVDYMAPPDDDPDKVARDICATVRAKMMPKAYVVLTPECEIDFSGMVTNCIVTASQAHKFTVIDTLQVFERGGHRPELEEQLYKASFTAEAPDCLPPKLWVDLFLEAFSKSANPAGPFLITSFPTPSSINGVGPTIRDQFCMLEDIVILKDILHVWLSEDAFKACCPDDSLTFERQEAFDDRVNKHILTQYHKEQICDSRVENIPDGGEARAAQKVCGDFLRHLEGR